MTFGSAANRLASPKQASSTSNKNPVVIPKICGKVRFRPKLAPEAASIRLFGPGVNAAMVANRLNPRIEAISIGF